MLIWLRNQSKVRYRTFQLRYVLEHVDTEGKRVVELGSGCGVAGVAIARVGRPASMILTDHDEEVLVNLRATVRRNPASIAPRIARLRWGEDLAQELVGAADLVLGSDLVYEGNDLDGLAATMTRLLADDGVAVLASPATRSARAWATVERAFAAQGLVLRPCRDGRGDEVQIAGGGEMIRVMEARRAHSSAATSEIRSAAESVE